MRTARENVLIHGLFDWVSLASIHSDVLGDDPDAQLSQLQNQTLALVRSLVSDGLFEVGSVTRKDGFIAWNSSVDESMQRIYDMYITRFEDTDGWLWGCWLKLTEKGLSVAQSVEASTSDDPSEQRNGNALPP